MPGTIANLLLSAVSLEHFYITYIEMFAWNTPRTNKIFGLHKDPAFAAHPKSAILAGNQGLYNAFLAVGAAWAVSHSDQAVGVQLGTFFASCVSVAAIYGGLTSSPRIMLVQGLPAYLALGALWLGL